MVRGTFALVLIAFIHATTCAPSKGGSGNSALVSFMIFLYNIIVYRKSILLSKCFISKKL